MSAVVVVVPNVGESPAVVTLAIAGSPVMVTLVAVRSPAAVGSHVMVNPVVPERPVPDIPVEGSLVMACSVGAVERLAGYAVPEPADLGSRGSLEGFLCHDPWPFSGLRCAPPPPPSSAPAELSIDFLFPQPATVSTNRFKKKWEQKKE